MDKTPIYKYPASYALEQGELPQYRASMQSQARCKVAIDKVISDQWDGWTVPKDAASGVLKDFGSEKVSLVLAYTVQERKFDKRISGHNCTWAKTVPLYSIQPGKSNILLESHSAKLDIFIDVARKNILSLEQEKPSMKKRRCAQPDTACPTTKAKEKTPEQ